MRRVRAFLGRHRPGHATVIAYLALFVALGGGAYALSGIPDVGGVFHGCVSNKTGVLRVVKSASKCHPPRGRGKRRDPGEFAVSWNQQGPRGLSGANGQAFDANATLPSGQTLTGIWAVGGGASDNVGTQVEFTPRLSADLPAGAVQRVISTPTPQCPGPSQAARGFFCLYEKASNLTFGGIFDTATQLAGANRAGAVIQYSGTAANQAANGTWAVTAP